MRIIIVRHAQSDGNISELVQGTGLDAELTEKGREQAERVGKKLADVKIDMAFVSPALRTKETAKAILHYHPNIESKVEPRILERDSGDTTGMLITDALAMIQKWLADGKAFGEFKPKNGESWNESGNRIVNFVKELIDNYKETDQTFLLVTHGSVSTYLLMWADSYEIKDNDKAGYDEYHPDNTAVAVIDVTKDGQIHLESKNDTVHLE